jgi:hypothetical protein
LILEEVRAGALRVFPIRLAQRLERGPELGAEQLRLFPRCEVSALVDLVEVGQVAIGAAGPGLRCPIDVLRKDCNGDRERDFAGLLCGRNE